MKKALITGVNGQTGSYLAELLLTRGWSIVGTGLTQESPIGAPPGLTFASLDISDTSKFSQIISDFKPDCVINLAAQSSVWNSWIDPISTTITNGEAVVGMLSVLHEFKSQNGLDIKFVQASSAEIYAESSQSPQNENTPIRPNNPYGASKAFAHFMTCAYRSKGLNTSNVILYNHESPRRPLSFVSRKISSSVALIEAGELDFITLGDISIKRDWGWAPDYADAISLVAETSYPGDFVVASGNSYSIQEFIELAFLRIGVTDWRNFIRIDSGLHRPSDSMELRGDSSKIRSELGWKPRKSFEEIVTEMVDYDRRLLKSPQNSGFDFDTTD